MCQHKGLFHFEYHLVSVRYLHVHVRLTRTRGLIGPSRLFSKGAMYYPQVWAALGGALLPIPLWLWMRKYPRSVLRNVNVPVIFNGGNAMPPANGVNYSSFLIVGFIFQFWIRRRHFAWWSKVSARTDSWCHVDQADTLAVQLCPFGRFGRGHRVVSIIHLPRVAFARCEHQLVGEHRLHSE